MLDNSHEQAGIFHKQAGIFHEQAGISHEQADKYDFFCGRIKKVYR